MEFLCIEVLNGRFEDISSTGLIGRIPYPPISIALRYGPVREGKTAILKKHRRSAGLHSCGWLIRGGGLPQTPTAGRRHHHRLYKNKKREDLRPRGETWRYERPRNGNQLSGNV